MIAAKCQSFALCRTMQIAFDCPDVLWYHSILQNDLSGCKLSAAEATAVVDGAMRTAEDMAQQIKNQYGKLSPQELAVTTLGLKLVQTAGDLEEPYLNFGLYEPGTRTITLNESAILLAQHFVGANGLEGIAPSNYILPTALFHEIFHALEDGSPDIYTRSKMLKRKVLGIFPFSRGLGSASEIGAVHFSKCMTGVTYSPCIYERYLLLALDLLSIDFLLPSV